MTAALLHYHLGYLFADDFRHLVQEEVDRRQHPSNAVERRRYLKALPEVAGRQSLLSQDSVRFESSRQLLELGVLRASSEFLQWSKTAGSVVKRKGPRDRPA